MRASDGGSTYVDLQRMYYVFCLSSLMFDVCNTLVIWSSQEKYHLRQPQTTSSSGDKGSHDFSLLNSWQRKSKFRPKMYIRYLEHCISVFRLPRQLGYVNTPLAGSEERETVSFNTLHTKYTRKASVVLTLSIRFEKIMHWLVEKFCLNNVFWWAKIWSYWKSKRTYHTFTNHVTREFELTNKCKIGGA